MTLRRYERYKDSGVEWLGPVPAHWEVTRLKFIAHVQTGVAKGKDNTGQETVLVPYLRVANVQDGYLDLDEVSTIEIPADDLPRYRLRAGDVLMNEGGDFDKLGRGHIWDGSIDPCIHQNHVFAVRPFGVSPQWLNLVTGSAYAQFYFMSRSKQSTNLASISSTNVMELPVVLPPAAEQEWIAAYLSNETAKIVTLIAEQQVLIELLSDKRQAVVAHAVAKGLNPSAPMKDSGVEWLGTVPTHWRVSALGYVAAIETGATPDRANPTFWNGETPWLKTGEINYHPIRAAEEFITDLGLANSAAKVAPPGTLLMAMYGQGVTRGRVAVLEIACAYNQACSAISFGPFVNPHFARYFFIAAYEHVRDAGNETSQMNLSAGIIRKFKLTVPPISEQAAIVSVLDNETERIDGLLLEAEQAIALLRERRSALISAAVIGQIDVRHRARRDTALAETAAEIGS